MSNKFCMNESEIVIPVSSIKRKSEDVDLGMNPLVSKIDKRKAISLAYHPDDYPFTITTGYSESFGPSLTVSYRISFYKQATE